MADYDLTPELDPSPKLRVKETREDAPDTVGMARAIEHARPDALGAKGAMHLQRAAGNAAMGALVQRSTEEESPVHAVVGKGGGAGLDTGVRSQMEDRFGRDFGGVRVHTGPDASAAAKSVQAQAFTVGQDVVFNDGKYAPSSPEGQRTIAHELTHVVQQSEGSVPGEPAAGGVKVSDPGDWAEQQAEATADAVMSSGDHAGHEHGDAGPGGAGAASVQTLPLQRDETGEEMGEESVQTLRDPSVQREGEVAPEQQEEEEEPEEEPVQALDDPTVQREGEGEEEELVPT